MTRKKKFQLALLLAMVIPAGIYSVRDELYFAPARREEHARLNQHWDERNEFIKSTGRGWDSLTGPDHYQIALNAKKFRLYKLAIWHLDKADQLGCDFDTSRVRAACESGLAGGSDHVRHPDFPELIDTWENVHNPVTRTELNRRHAVQIKHFEDSSRKLHGELNGMDHWNIGNMHAWEGYYAEAIASYEEAERLGFGNFTVMKDECRAALKGDNRAVEERRQKSGTRWLPKPPAKLEEDR